MEIKDWKEARKFTPEKFALARRVLEAVQQGEDVSQAVRKNPLPGGAGYLGKNVLVAAYRQLIESGEWSADPELLARIRMKPVRTLSGVTVVTVLTKPYPCPGGCVFCPTDTRMPKSYLPDEPGAMRGLHHDFDPFDQVASRLEALQAVGHPTDKIELLILGGTWSAYPKGYQQWFVRRCFDALNGEIADSLQEAQTCNETASHRNVGMAVETRPDLIDVTELVWLRTLGVTKVQIGAQSFDNRILQLNKRGHRVEDTQKAVALLRQAGFKIVLHWMPNLLGATPESDREDFLHMWAGLSPDEIKIYPTQLLANSQLYKLWLDGKFKTYTTQELVGLIADIKTTIPRYCRVNRVVRDIPSTNVVEGNKRTSLRQDIQREMRQRGTQCQCIRCREIRRQTANRDQLRTEDLVYETGVSQEHFLSYVTLEDRLAGFLRLCLPHLASGPGNQITLSFPELVDAAIIREVHVYGQSLELGAQQGGLAQHIGLGSELVSKAEEIARDRGFKRMAIIAAVGTRQYYLQRGYTRGNHYMIKELSPEGSS